MDKKALDWKSRQGQVKGVWKCGPAKETVLTGKRDDFPSFYREYRAGADHTRSRAAEKSILPHRRVKSG